MDDDGGPPIDHRIPAAIFNDLFRACFRIQREASASAGRYIPLIVENVKGAQPWVGRARWHYGSFYLWGDVPALMPVTLPTRKSQHAPTEATPGGTGTTSWFFGNSKGEGRHYGTKVPSESGRRTDVGKGARFTTRDCGVENEATKLGGSWFHGYRKGQGPRNHGSNSTARKAASAMIAKIPFDLARHIARVFKD